MIIIYKMDFYFEDLLKEEYIDKVNSEISKFDFKDIINKYPELKDRIELIGMKVQNPIGGEFIISVSDNIEQKSLRQNVELDNNQVDKLVDLLIDILEFLSVDKKITGFRHNNIMVKNLNITEIVKIGE